MLKRIVIASILKPVDDIRNYEKLGISLANTGNFHLDIVGFHSHEIPVHKNISFYPIYHFNRLNLKRIFSGYKFLRLLFSLKADLLIINTHELLLPAVFYKMIFRIPVIYDVRENYFRNIKYGSSFGRAVKSFLAIYVRIKERLTQPFISLYFLAEDTYRNELPFVRGKSIIVANKSIPLPQKKSFMRKPELRFILSGTIAKEYGVFEAIDFSESLNNGGLKNKLLIMGRCAHGETLREIEHRSKNLPYIELKVSSRSLPHKKIIEEALEADFALMPYRLVPHIRSRFPTKIYECMAMNLPMIISRNEHWKKFCDQYQAAIFLDFSNLNIQKIITTLENSDFYIKRPGNEIFWDTEAQKVITAIDKILNMNS